jgi:hypothetical protein
MLPSEAKGKILWKRAPQELLFYFPCIGSTIWLLQISAWCMIRALFMSFCIWTILHICLSVCSNKCLLIIFDWWALAYKLDVSLPEVIPSRWYWRIARFAHERIDTIQSTYQIVRDDSQKFYIYIYIYIYIGRVYSIANYKITYFVATSIYDNFIY